MRTILIIFFLNSLIYIQPDHGCFMQPKCVAAIGFDIIKDRLERLHNPGHKMAAK